MREKPRDPALERLLGATLQGSLRAGSDACPDAETLAAWCESGLPQPQRKEIEAHLANCGRCQSQLAALARSETVGEPPPARTSTWWSWRWVVPAAVGATALALVLYVQPDVLRRAQKEQKEAPLAAKVEPPSAPTTPHRTLDSAGTARNDAPAAFPRATGAAPETETRTHPPTDQPSASKQAFADRLARDAEQTAKSDKAATTAEATSAARAPKTAAEGTSAPATPAVTQAPKQKRDEVIVSGASPVLAIPPTFEIVSSDPSVRWRTRGHDVEHTVDAGATWTKQATGATELLTAGASPSPGVCWIVGERGTVLRSTDGRTWHTIPFPERIGLVRIEAAGPDQATVTTTDGRRFTTADAGKSWTSGGLQDF